LYQVDNNTEELLAENTYNELSQLANKKVGNNLQSIDYTYNIRGWMTHINKDQMALGNLGGKLFSYSIKYNQKEGIENPDQVQFSGKNVKAKYNGNIAEVDWRAVETLGVNPSSTPKRYGYAYDNLNRLTAGYYQNPNNPNSKENTESLDYDLNGNITNLYRTSVISYGTNTATVIDNLSYAYAEGGNKLTGITDSSQNQTGYENYPPTYPINYDLNGNMLSMYGKGISSIHYNFLNLPNEIYMGFYSPFYVSHMYRADGSKLRKNTVSTVTGFVNSTVTTEVTDYLDGFQYKNTKVETLGGGGGPGDVELLLAAPVETRRAMEMEAFSLEDLIEPADPGIINPIGGIAAILKTQDLQFFPTAEGFYDYQKDQYIYQYKDHLGNARVSFGKNSAGVLEITDANDYYPFGMNHLKTGNAFFGGSYKAYKYQGQELQETGFYSFKWRNYMPDVGRFFNIDVLAQDYDYQTPYAFSENKVTNHIELEGLESVHIGVGGAPVTPSSPSYGSNTTGFHPVGTGAWTELKGMFINNWNFWTKQAEINYGVITTIGSVAAQRVLNSEGDDKGKGDKKEPSTKKKGPNPNGSKGNPDHQEKVKELEEKAKSEFPDDDVITEKKIKKEGSNRRPDVQVVDSETGETKKIYEAERKPNSTRNKKREAEYERLKIPNETHPVGN